MKVIWNVVRTKIKIIIVKFWGSFWCYVTIFNRVIDSKI